MGSGNQKKGKVFIKQNIPVDVGKSPYASSLKKPKIDSVEISMRFDEP